MPGKSKGVISRSAKYGEGRKAGNSSYGAGQSGYI